MRWQVGRRSENVEDRRYAGRGMAIGGLSGSAIVVSLLASWLLGVNPLEMLALLSGPELNVAYDQGGAPPPADDAEADFVRAILGDTEDTWRALFERERARYVEPRLVLFSGVVRSACGGASAAPGPLRHVRGAGARARTTKATEGLTRVPLC